MQDSVVLFELLRYLAAFVGRRVLRPHDNLADRQEVLVLLRLLLAPGTFAEVRWQM